MPPRSDPDWNRVLRYSSAQTAHLPDRALEELLEETDRRNIEAARASSAAFVEYVLTHEKDGSLISNADFHREWHDSVANNDRVVIISAIEHAKTQQIAIGYVLWAIGKNPNLRCALICDTATQAEERLGSIKLHIETNERLWKVFPHLKPEQPGQRPTGSKGWSCSAITVPRRTISKDPTVIAAGSGGPINGKRLDLIILDDVLDFDNTRTAEGCAKIIEWFDTTCATRCVEGGKIVAIGTPWSAHDLLAILQKRPIWFCRVYGAVLNPDDPVRAWRPRWPGAWTLLRLLTVYENTPTLTFWRKYMCRITSDATSRFRAAWFARAKALGRGRTFLQTQPVLAPQEKRLPCFCGVDLGSSPRKKRQHGSADHGSGLTVFSTIAIDERARRLFVNLESGRWTGPGILDKLADYWSRYRCTFIVENNGVQDWMVQFGQMRGIPIVPFNTTAGAKYDEVYGVESLAVEMRSELWIWPSGVRVDGKEVTRIEGYVDPELLALEAEMTAFNPDSHTGDRLMATWFAREGANTLIAEIVKHLPTIPR